MLLSVAVFLTNLPESKKSNINSMLSENFLDSDSHSEVCNSILTFVARKGSAVADPEKNLSGFLEGGWGRGPQKIFLGPRPSLWRRRGATPFFGFFSSLRLRKEKPIFHLQNYQKWYKILKYLASCPPNGINKPFVLSASSRGFMGCHPHPLLQDLLKFLLAVRQIFFYFTTA